MSLAGPVSSAAIPSADVDGGGENLRRRDLLAARNGAIALRRRRPDLKFICTDIIENAELQLKWPEDAVIRGAGARLFGELLRRLSRKDNVQ